ncbi:transforming growth factor-beta-induced protein ig-h3 [Procambarus clarkii]|uniref:transforming growth factor-beta-induced protein ig-h3 n=1 Tax=Procambarus clarkii TaxID=6728 RepID=UPI001E673F3D|nr:transforming growth factor-beta-induced protein ig-h3-like [Procambarus clarkii]
MTLLKILTAAQLLLIVLVTAERDGRMFNRDFTRNKDNLHWEGQLRMSSLQDAMDQLSSTLDTALGSLSDRIEQQVEGSLPLWMRNKNKAGGAMGSMPDDLGIEAISGNLGDGIDDGLEVQFEGDGEPLAGSRFDETSGSPGSHSEVTGVDQSQSPDYAPGFTFNPFFPFGAMGRRPGFNIFNGMSGRRVWWKGPNVCVDREEIDEGKDLDADGTSISGATGSSFIFAMGSMEVTSCSETRDKYTCTSKSSSRGLHKTVVVTYRCCHGYIKEDSECSKVELLDLPETLQKIEATDFLSLIKTVGAGEILKDNVTLFVPTNEAMQEYTADLEAENELDNALEGDRSLNEVFYRRRRSTNTQSLILSHVTKGIFYGSDLHDEQVLNSLANNSTLRINTYSTNPPAATVNCARLVKLNQYSSSGVVHTIDRVLEPVTKSLADLITSDPQFSVLKRLVSQAGLLSQLREPGQLTVFAPTDDAFNSLAEPVLEALIDGSACLEAVVKNHILPNVICSAAIQGKARTVNLLENYLLLEKTEDDKIFVEDAQVVVRDVVGTNGVLHIIDSPLMPQEAKPVTEVLEGHNLTSFLDLLEAAGMIDELASMTDVTVFAPSNRAIDELPEDVLNNLKNDPSKLREILLYHMATPSLQANDIANDHIATTRADHPLRINLYSRSPILSGVLGTNGRRHVRLTAGCSRVSVLDSRACGAVVHIVEKMLKMPKTSVMQHLEEEENFSIFTKMLQNTGLNETLSEEGPFTVLAPTDHVFRTLPDMELKQILEDVDLQKLLIKQHVLKEHVCCAGINPSTWLFMDHKRPMEGTPIHVRRTSSGRLMAGSARITHCSAPTLNGLVHTVNHLLVNVHPRQQVNTQVRTNRPIFSAPGFEILFG